MLHCTMIIQVEAEISFTMVMQMILISRRITYGVSITDHAIMITTRAWEKIPLIQLIGVHGMIFPQSFQGKMVQGIWREVI